MVAIYNSDYRKIEKLNKLNNIDTFWDDVRKLTKKVYSDFSIGRWQCLAETRYDELLATQTKQIKNYSYSLYGEDDDISMDIFVTDLNDKEFSVATISQIGVMTDTELDNLAQETLNDLGYELV